MTLKADAVRKVKDIINVLSFIASIGKLLPSFVLSSVSNDKCFEMSVLKPINYNLSGFFLNIVWHVFNDVAVITLEKHIKAGGKMVVL
jgi:hypothetical protein